MNIFDLPGPEFLFVYVILLVLWSYGFVVYRRWRESTPIISYKKEVNPYAIAHLRGGVREALKIALATLIDREIIKMTEDHKYISDPARAGEVTDRTEKDVYHYFETARPIRDLRDSTLSRRLSARFDSELREMGALPGAGDRRGRAVAVLLSIAILEIVLIIKFCLALSRNRTNVAGLVILAIVVPIVFLILNGKKKTARGERFLGDLKNLFHDPQARSRAKHATDPTEAILLAAAVGDPAFYNFGHLPPAFSDNFSVASHPDRHGRHGSESRPASHPGSSCGAVTGCSSSSGADSGGGASGCGSSGCGGGGGGCGGCGSS